MGFQKGNKVGRAWSNFDIKAKVEKRALTSRQKEVFEFVRLYIEKYSMPPTRQEIADAFEFKSVNAAQQHLLAISRKGWLTLRGTGSAYGRVMRGIGIA